MVDFEGGAGAVVEDVHEAGPSSVVPVRAAVNHEAPGAVVEPLELGADAFRVGHCGWTVKMDGERGWSSVSEVFQV